MTPFPTPPNRRRFLLGTAGACAALGAGAWQYAKRPRKWELVRRTSHALGAAVTISVCHRDARSAEAALDAAFAELDQVENVMSLYRPESQVCELNRAGFIERPDPRLVTVLNYAAEVAETSGGAFDVTVQPLWELYRAAQKQGHLPDEDAVRETCKHVGWRRVQVAPDRIAFANGGTAITLNGIAQGFAGDAAMAALRNAGVAHALIDTGEMGALGGKPEGSAWRVGIQHPRQPGAFIALADLQDRCLATSGDYETTFSGNFLDHHLFDPSTGHSPKELASVSIVAPNAMQADALSTAVFVLGAERGMGVLRTMPGTDGYMVFKDGRTLATEGFPSGA
jgi:FAD:protein FMN transferase